MFYFSETVPIKQWKNALHVIIMYSDGMYFKELH